MANGKPKPIPKLTQRQIDRFWSKVDVRGPDECWPWNSSRNAAGYGLFFIHIPGDRWRAFLSNRIAYSLINNVDPGGKLVCHACDVPGCCNGRHLWLGDVMDNIKDKIAKGRGNEGDKNGSRTRPDRVSRGASRPGSKLTEEKVMGLRRLYDSGIATQADIRRMCNMSSGSVHRMLHRITWKHVV